MSRFKIWSNEHNAWWLSGQWGYTENYNEAGIYDEDEAKAICWKSHFDTRPGTYQDLDVPMEVLYPLKEN